MSRTIYNNYDDWKLDCPYENEEELFVAEPKQRGRVITVQELPPIPVRRWDWCAYHDGEEELSHTHGWGATEKEALVDLEQIDVERDAEGE